MMILLPQITITHDSVEPVKGNLRLSGYSACGQDGGVQLPRGYIEGTFYLLSSLYFL